VSEFRYNWTPEMVADEFLSEIRDKLTPLETLNDVLD
jgi:hypothetical protein